MARYKEYDYSQGKIIPIHFDKQILPGTFEYSLHYLIDNEIDLSIFDLRYRNDETGAPAYDPAILLKIILYAYSRGITSSRKIAQCCRENIIFMALSADTQPHFTTIAEFISSSDQEIIELFLEVLLICDEMGLIGKEMFAGDGCKLPSNASKEWSGTKGELEKKKEKMEKVIRQMVRRHWEVDGREATDKTEASYKASGSRQDLLRDPTFKAAFDAARDRIKVIDIRYVEENDPVRQALLEIYVAIACGTTYNNFENH